MTLRLKRTPGIYLVGFMGSGKTTVGRHLANELGWNFVDTDSEIEARERASIAEIFDTRGQEEFRRLETEVIRAHLRAVCAGKPTVAALGGGAFIQPENYDLLVNNGITIWLDCPFERVLERVSGSGARPLARDLGSLARLYESRLPLYARADYRVESHHEDPSVTVGGILKLPIF